LNGEQDSKETGNSNGVLTSLGVLEGDMLYQQSNGEKVLLGGSINSLVARLADNNQDHIYLKTFLLTHSHFMSSVELFEKLVHCYQNFGKKPKNEEEIKNNGIHQMRVINAIKKWMHFNLYDFGVVDVQEKFRQFCNELSLGNDNEKSWSNHLTEAWKSALLDRSTKREDDEFFDEAPKPYLSKKNQRGRKQSPKD